MQDKGHLRLVSDISALLNEVFNYEFHDYKNKKYAAPKMELVLKLDKLIEKVKDGQYDN